MKKIILLTTTICMMVVVFAQNKDTVSKVNDLFTKKGFIIKGGLSTQYMNISDYYKNYHVPIGGAIQFGYKFNKWIGLFTGLDVNFYSTHSTNSFYPEHLGYNITNIDSKVQSVQYGFPIYIQYTPFTFLHLSFSLLAGVVFSLNYDYSNNKQTEQSTVSNMPDKITSISSVSKEQSNYILGGVEFNYHINSKFSVLASYEIWYATSDLATNIQNYFAKLGVAYKIPCNKK